jgi:glycosyltransferase involved in cell wall biosynthesis
VRIVQLNLAFDPTLATPSAVLDRYHTLTGWSRALTDAGAEVTVVQRYSTNTFVSREGVGYHFVVDGHRPLLPAWTVPHPCLSVVSELAPDVVHVNGLMFPATTRALREKLGPRVTIVLQDHSGIVGSAGWLPRFIVKRRWHDAFLAADACTFTDAQLATRWHRLGFPPRSTIIEIPEASTNLGPVAQDAARAQTGVIGSPAVLWVGRAHALKDPETALAGFHKVATALPEAQFWMIASTENDRAALDVQLRHDRMETPRVHLLGPIPHSRMHLYYSAADLLLSSSHHEGSGYAVLEALACGLTPCVTDIPAFRALVGNCGERWPPGDADACAAAIENASKDLSSSRRQEIRAFFMRELSWAAIGRQTLHAYSRLYQVHA